MAQWTLGWAGSTAEALSDNGLRAWLDAVGLGVLEQLALSDAAKQMRCLCVTILLLDQQRRSQ